MYVLSVIIILIAVPGILGAATGFLTTNSYFDNIPLAIFILAAFVVAIFILFVYGCLELIQDSSNFSYIRLIVANFAASGGTSFRKANLTKAIFEEANLKGVDFREANIKHTNFRGSENLHQARQEYQGYSVLSSPAVRELLITGDGQKKAYAGENLRGVYLDGAKLDNANF